MTDDEKDEGPLFLDEESDSHHDLPSSDEEEESWKEIALKAEAEIHYLESTLLETQKKVNQLEAEVQKLKAPPLIIGTVLDILEDGRAVIKSTTGPKFCVHVSPRLDAAKLTVGDRVALNKDTLAIIEKLSSSKDPMVGAAEVIEKPDLTYEDVGGLENVIEEIKESVEYPLKFPERFHAIGIDPPAGVLLIGPPGTGKTLVVKAVCNETDSTFIHVVGSELVQKFIGEGSRLVREVFELASEKSPSIVFIDEIDAIAAKRLDSTTSADREVQRTLIQLLAELDGFTKRENVMIIAATNRPDILDPALMRPGRFDRIIKFPLPTREARLQILKIHTKGMKLAKSVHFDVLADLTDDFSGALIKSLCTEAGMFAIRAGAKSVSMVHFKSALAKIQEREKENTLELNDGSKQMFV